jgi:hypothetical protein
MLAARCFAVGSTMLCRFVALHAPAGDELTALYIDVLRVLLLCGCCRWCAGDVAVSQHMPDLVHVGSTTSAAIKDANKIQSISRWLVLAKPLPGTAGPGVGAGSGRSRRDGTAAEAEATALRNAKAAALDRSLLLFKLLGNLHYWAPELPQQLQQRFVKLLVGGLRSSARSESEFTVACHRVTLNLQRLLNFLEPVSPDEDTADDEGDLLVNQLEIDLIADLRKSVAKLSMSAWRDALPGPTVSGIVSVRVVPVV